jgi:acylphosphatase
MMKRVKAIISGRVQGVWFRASTQEKALEYGVRGTVRNLVDGRVELVAEGEVEQVDLLLRWAANGPPMAAVDRVELEELPPDEEYSDFLIR